MFIPARLRRSVILFLVMVTTGLALFLIIFPSPDLSQENSMLRSIAELSLRIGQAEQINSERKRDLHQLYGQLLRRAKHDDDRLFGSDLRGLSIESQAFLKGVNWTFDLSLPGIHQFLPHTVDRPDSLVPGFKMAPVMRERVGIVLGVPTVKRDHQSYLHVTLKSLVDNLGAEEEADTVIIVCVAEPYDDAYVASVAADIKKAFPAQVESGLIEVMSPPPGFYPDMNKLRRTLGDEPERVQWRSKQNLDYAFLMMYAQWRGTFYVQASLNFVSFTEFSMGLDLRRKFHFKVRLF